MTETPVNLAIVLFHLFIPSARPFSFNIPQFDGNTRNVTYEGDAKAVYGYVDLTDADANMFYRVGRVVCSNPVLLWENSTGKVADFTARFKFSIDTLDNRAGQFSDGFAFFMAPVGYEIPPNSGGGYLGLLNVTTGKSFNGGILMIEFDTYSNREYDPPSSHVGINIDAIVSVVHATWDAVSANRKTADCRVSYDSTSKNLSVSWEYEDDPKVLATSYLSYSVDLAKVLPERVTVGFSAATGLAKEKHMLKSWEFSSNLDADDRHRKEKKSKKSSMGIIVACCAFTLVGAGLAYLLIKWRKSKKSVNIATVADSSINRHIEKGAFTRRFSYKDLEAATNGFSAERRLGKGGSGNVYKGILSDLGHTVAVKRIFADQNHPEKFFLNEVKIISRLIHQNLVRFIGWCHERGEFMLVFEYMPNGSLDSHLFGNRKSLAWEVRYRIALGLAMALRYLHEEAGQCVIHRDIKSANVLLDVDFNTKLGDFGVAKLVDPQLRTQLTRIVGTYGYLAPEYLNEGRASKGSDVFSYGIVALEIACGRKTYFDGEYHVALVKWVWRLYVAGKLLDAADERLESVFDEDEIELLLIVGLWCTNSKDKERPKIGEVIKVLKREAPAPELPLDMHDHDNFAPDSTQGTDEWRRLTISSTRTTLKHL